MKITLSKPVQFGSETIAELEFREESNVGDLMDMPADREKHTIGDYLRIAASLCGKPMAVLKKLSTQDMEAVLAQVGEAIAPGQKDGAS